MLVLRLLKMEYTGVPQMSSVLVFSGESDFISKSSRLGINKEGRKGDPEM